QGKYSDVPGQPNAEVAAKREAMERFQKGDKVSVVFSGIASELAPLPHMENIKDDGTITLPNLGSVQAAGKTPGELQRDIFNLYFRLFSLSNRNTPVTARERFYFVGGEVKSPNRFVYNGETTVLKAIQTAGDFTVFANTTRVRLTRADGTTIMVNC